MASNARKRAVALAMALITLLTAYSGWAIYLSRDDKRSVASIVLAYVYLVLLAWLVACLQQPSPGKGSRLVAQVLEVTIVCLTLPLTLLLASQLRRILPPVSSELLLPVSAAAVVVAFFLVFVLKHAWSNEQSQEATLPLVQPLQKQ
uniref:Uncharacterized protein n=1 Tax=Oryza glumipatula TaxID=40148 RepID=A0A0D9YPB2_9ORYZ